AAVHAADGACLRPPAARRRPVEERVVQVILADRLRADRHLLLVAAVGADQVRRPRLESQVRPALLTGKLSDLPFGRLPDRNRPTGFIWRRAAHGSLTWASNTKKQRNEETKEGRKTSRNSASR